MKKMFLAAFFLTAALTMSAQSRPGTFSLIPKLGVSIAKITKEDIYYDNGHPMKPKYRAGFTAGLEGEYQCTEVFSLTLGAYYAALGYRTSDTEILQTQTDEQAVYSAYHDRHTRLDYILVPVMANLYLAPGFAVKAGVQAGFLVHDKYEVEVSDVTYDKSTGVGTYGESQTLSGSSTNGYHQFDLSVPLGLSYEYMNVVLDARYNLGLLKVSNTSGAKNSFFTFTVGYKFNL